MGKRVPASDDGSKQNIGCILFATAEKTLTSKTLHRFRRAEAGTDYSPKDFLDLGGRGSISWVLHDLVRREQIRRVTSTGRRVGGVDAL